MRSTTHFHTPRVQGTQNCSDKLVGIESKYNAWNCEIQRSSWFRLRLGLSTLSLEGRCGKVLHFVLTCLLWGWKARKSGKSVVKGKQSVNREMSGDRQWRGRDGLGVEGEGNTLTWIVCLLGIFTALFYTGVGEQVLVSRLLVIVWLRWF